MKQELINLSTYVVERTRTRLDGLTDDEYAWMPVENGWHLRPNGQGGVTMDFAYPEPVPTPFTSLAWRLYHLVGTYAGERTAVWLNVEAPPSPLMGEGSQPVDAASAVALLHRSQDWWLACIEAATDAVLESPLGEKAGAYGDATGADVVLHQIDEHIHHGAELALLRDLYRSANA